MDGMVATGKVGGLFGNKGEVTLTLYDSFPRDPDFEEPLFVTIDGHAVPLFLERFARRGVRGATAVFADIDTPGRASELIGRELMVRTNSRKSGINAPSADPDDELYFEDLVGWIAEMGEGRTGRITAFHDSEFNPLLEITLDTPTTPTTFTTSTTTASSELIPAQEEFIASIDEDNRRVAFSLPEGLLGLNS